MTANTSGGNAHYGMLVAVGASNVTLNNADFSDNDIDGSLLGDVVGCHSSYDNSTLNVSYSNRYKTAGQTYYTPCMEGSFSTDDPAYVDPTSGNWDLTLSSGSDLIDAGDPDVDDADGSRSDIGAMGGPGGDDW